MANKDSDDETEAPKQNKSALVMWVEDQWEGWLKSTGSIFLFAIAYVLYKFDLVSEGVAGAGFVLAVVLGSLGSVVFPAWPLVRVNWQKSLMIVMSLVAIFATGYPSLRAAIPPKALAETKLTTTQLSSTVHLPSTGPYELAIAGSFKQQGGEAEISYDIKATGTSGSDEVQGSMSRSQARVRTSRRGGTSTMVIERTENQHRMPSVRGPDVTFTVDGVDDQLAEGLILDVRPAGPNPILFIILGALSILAALFLDAKLVDPKRKVKTYLTVGVAIPFVFSLRFPDVATPHSLVKPGVEALVIGLVIGGLGGWVLGALAKIMLGPKVKKAAR
jgi:hypothetical protein